MQKLQYALKITKLTKFNTAKFIKKFSFILCLKLFDTNWMYISKVNLKTPYQIFMIS